MIRSVELNFLYPAAMHAKRSLFYIHTNNTFEALIIQFFFFLFPFPHCAFANRLFDRIQGPNR